MKRILVIPDSHQDVEWLNSIDRIENFDTFDKIIFIGDYFDSRNPAVPNVKVMCQYLIALKARLKNKVVLLIGNHDLAYIEFSMRCRSKFTTKHPLNFHCTGFSNGKGTDIHRKLYLECINAPLRDEFKFYHVEDGILFTHAGLSYNWFSNSYDEDPQQIINKTLGQLDNVYNAINSCPPIIKQVAASRLVLPKPDSPKYGSIVWEDAFDFIDNPYFKQVFGHTADDNTIKQYANAVCIDGGQTTYLVIEDNKFIYKTTSNEPLQIFDMQQNKII